MRQPMRCPEIIHHGAPTAAGYAQTPGAAPSFASLPNDVLAQIAGFLGIKDR